MEIKLDEFYTIKLDNKNFALHYREETNVKNKKDEFIVKTDVWWCVDLAHALKSYMRESLRKSDSINNVLERLKEIENNIDKCLALKLK